MPEKPDRRRSDKAGRGKATRKGRNDRGPSRGDPSRADRGSDRRGQRGDRRGPVPVDEAPPPKTVETLEAATTLRLDGQGQTLVKLESGERGAVRGALPDESITVRRLETGKLVRHELASLEISNPARVEAPCPHFGTCAGCRLQQASDTARLGWLVERVRHILGERCQDLPELEAPSAGLVGLGTRPRTTFFRTEQGGLALPSIRSRALEAIRECPVTDPRAMAVARAIVDEAKARRVDSVEAIIVHAAAGTPSVHATLVADTGRLPHAQRLAEAAREAGANGISLTPKSDRREELLGPRTIPLLGEPRLHEQIAGIDLRVSPHSFVEPSASAAAGAVEFLRENTTYAETAIDLFCGSGLWTFALAEGAKRVIGIDHQQNSIHDAEIVVGDRPVQFHCAKVEYEMEALGHLDASLVTADPPRGGLRELAAAIARQIRPARLIVSGRDPVEFARDLSQLQTLGYSVQRLRLLETDPWNFGVLLLAVLEDDGEA